MAAISPTPFIVDEDVIAEHIPPLFDAFEDPPVSHLPPEILSRIFQLVCSAEIFESDTTKYQRRIIPSSPIRLAAVSPYWRGVAYSTPYLWSTLQLNVECTGIDVGERILELFMRSSGHTAFRLELDATAEGLWQDMGFPLTLLRPALFQSGLCRRVEYLKVRSPPPTVLGIPESWLDRMNSDSFPSLKELHLLHQMPSNGGPPRGGPGYREVWVSLDRLPSIRLLSLQNFVQMCIPPPMVVTLRLRGVALETCVDLLVQCPHLVEFHCRNPRVSAHCTITHHLEVRSIVKEKLRVFEWDFDGVNYDWYNNFYNRLRMPCLEFLRFTNRDRDPCNYPHSMLSFLTSVSFTLKHLKLSKFRLRAPKSITDIFARLPQIKDLTVEDVGDARHSCYRDIIQALDPAKVTRQGKHDYLPSLRSFTLIHSKSGKLSSFDQFSLLNMLEERAVSGDCLKLCVSLQGFHKFEWGDRHERTLRGLIERSMLEINIIPCRNLG